jgi:thiamine-phosphate pyrophosphorylase
MDGQILRLFDASLNRLREGLRVCEDCARFVLNDQPTTEALKQIRHDVAAATAPLAALAIGLRDTPGDVGTLLSTPAEQRRADLLAVVTAAGKRTGEALRSCEEYAKVLDPAAARVLEACRYRWYAAEQRLVLQLAAPDFSPVRLYVLITESVCKRPWQEVAEAAIAGGADCLQLREKGLDGGPLLERARWLVARCHRHGVLCIINDRADVAALSGADGVHVGQTDLPVTEVRKLLASGGRSGLVGVSTHCMEDARRAVADGADYIGVGPVFPSQTKPRAILPGLDYASAVASQINLPAVAIAGITAENLPEVLATGIKAVAVTSAVTASPDPQAATATLKAMLTGGAR